MSLVLSRRGSLIGSLVGLWEAWIGVLVGVARSSLCWVKHTLNPLGRLGWVGQGGRAASISWEPGSLSCKTSRLTSLKASAMTSWITGTLGLLMPAKAPDNKAACSDLPLAITECQRALHQRRRLQLPQAHIGHTHEVVTGTAKVIIKHLQLEL